MTPKSEHPASGRRAVPTGNGRAGTAMRCPRADGIGLADDTLIPTPEGWISLGEIAPGAQVFDQCGRTCTVVGVYPQGTVPVYRVGFDDGSALLAGGRHQWTTISDRQRTLIREGTRWLAMWATPAMFGITTTDIGASLIHNAGGCLKANHSIPVTQPLKLPERDLLIDPYVLGLWLGDGSSAAPLIHCDQADEPHYRGRARAAGEAWKILGSRENVLRCTMAHGSPPLFVTRLRRLGVLLNKHVPAEYLRASAEQRLALLHGLMDSDGHIDDRGQAEYTSISPQLAQGVMELAISLGQKAGVHKGLATLYGRVVSDKYRILFAPTIQVAGLPRKEGRLAPALQYRDQATLPRPAQRYINSVIPSGRWATTSIAVDSPYAMVLAGRTMIPTLISQP